MNAMPSQQIQGTAQLGVGWRAFLQLAFAYQESTSRTIVQQRKHHGPLLVQKPFYPEAETCHVYLVHPPAGMVGGDALQLAVTTQPGSHALLTTPAAPKFYRSAGAEAVLHQQLHVQADSILEWLPQENIFFDACQASMQTRVELEDGSVFTGWEIVCLGRPASGDDFKHGYTRQGFEVWRNKKPLFIERACYQGGNEILRAAWGMQSCTVTGTMLSTDLPQDNQLYESLRAVAPDEGMAGISRFAYGMVARYLGNHAIVAREYFTRLWEIIRPLQIRKKSCPPRIWAT